MLTSIIEFVINESGTHISEVIRQQRTTTWRSSFEISISIYSVDIYIYIRVPRSKYQYQHLQ